ncbi:MAG: NAD(P)H-hydrate dehydratase [Planctomycetota bacterium]
MSEGFEVIEALPGWPGRPSDGHKGTFGTLIVVGGSEGMIGAPALSRRAGLRVGAGLVKVVTEAGVLGSVLTVEPSGTGVGVAAWSGAGMEEVLGRVDERRKAVVAVGPGWGVGDGRGEALRVVLGSGRRVVVDADGLNVLAGELWKGGTGGMNPPAKRGEGELVLTPHPGEFGRLAAAAGLDVDADDRVRGAVGLARRLSGVVVLKGRGTVVSDGRRVYVNQTGNAALATAGTGDVLTGVIGGLMAQGMGGFDAAVLGVWGHGRAAEVLVGSGGAGGVLARELADAVGRVRWGGTPSR